MEAGKYKSKGFTLLEMMMAIAILAGSFLALSQGLAAGIVSSTDTENVGRALNIAQAKMETLKNTAFSGLVDSGPSADPDFTNFEVTVNVAEGQDPMRIDVTVNWNVKAGVSSVALTTLAADY